MQLDILYENDDVLVINKPAGLVVHQGAGVKAEETLADILLRERPELKGVGEDPQRPGIVHRLDKDTSGVLVVAKNQRTFFFLKEQFKNRTIEKTYLAIVAGAVKSPRGKITFPIARSGQKQQALYRGNRDQGIGKRVREAETEFMMRKRLVDATLLELHPKSGRMHQLRVHLAALGHPVLGDTLYGGKLASKRAQRQMLHASAISFSTPSGLRLSIEADPPEDFIDTLESLEKIRNIEDEPSIEY